MGQHDDYGPDKFPRLLNPGFHSDTPAWAIHLHNKMEGHITRTIMAAIDDLKTAIAGMISEATADVTALITEINAVNAAGAQDPAIAALADQVNSQTSAMHSAFTAATGTLIPTPAPAVVSSAAAAAASVTSVASGGTVTHS